MRKIFAASRSSAVRVYTALWAVWKRFRLLPRWLQAVIIALGVGLLFLLSSLGNTASEATQPQRAVTLRSLAELSGHAQGAVVVGTVRARNEADVRAEASGTVRAVHAAIGSVVPAGFIIAELENATERAQVTQAEGAYEAALAARAAVSPIDVEQAARNAYRAAFDTLDTTLVTNVDTLFGDTTPYGPDLLINPVYSDVTRLPRERDRIDTRMDAERTRLVNAENEDPAVLLASIDALANDIAGFVDELVLNVNANGSDATSEQVAAITTARTHITGVLSSITSAQASLRSGASGTTASVDASVKSALGTLRLAQAALEKTRLRAPIAGTINFLPLRVGDYVNMLDHVATVAQNGALEVVVYVSEENATGLISGAEVTIEDRYRGVVTAVSPALDPVTKQIEVRIAVDAGSPLVNGQSVRVMLPPSHADRSDEAASGPLLLPLSAVKLSAGSRVVFMLGEENRLRALTVEIGNVRGERIEVLTDLPRDLRIVTDARGLSDGQLVRVAEE